MAYCVFLLSACFLVGLLGVAANPSPFYGAGGLLLGALGGCGLLVSGGASFVGVVLFLIYLGGMLVVFAYSVALAAEPYPETWGSWDVLVRGGVYGGLVFCLGGFFVESVGGGEFGVGGAGAGLLGLREDLSGVVLLYSTGGGVLLACG